MKFQAKIFTTKKVIKLWNFGNFGIPKIIPKTLVTLRFSKISLLELRGICKCFQMSYWPNFYVDPTNSNACFFKVGKWRVSLQGTVAGLKKAKNKLNKVAHIWHWFQIHHNHCWNEIFQCFLHKKILNSYFWDEYIVILAILRLIISQILDQKFS